MSKMAMKIIVFDYVDTKYLIKRVIGLPGEKVEYKDNKLYINDKYIKEKFLKNITTKNFSVKDMGYDIIPKNMYLVLGDNRDDSIDSRAFGLIKKEEIIGKALITIFPFNHFSLIK
jgi:signal peptidase I